MNENQEIKVLELRNYLLKPGMADRFYQYFNEHFVESMTSLGGYTLGQFKLKGVNDRFIWMRGFTDMLTRIDFLNAFYVNSKEWKNFGPGANDMMINSDNVYLLRPLKGKLNEKIEAINSSLIESESGIVVVDFYIANGRLEEAVDLFNKKYIPFIKSKGVNNTTIWVSELSKNEFPRLPVFQDKNLLVTITHFENEAVFQSKIKQVDSPDAGLRNDLLEIITTRDRMILYPATSV